MGSPFVKSPISYLTSFNDVPDSRPLLSWDALLYKVSDLNVISNLNGLSGSRSGMKVNGSTGPVSGDATVCSLYPFHLKICRCSIFPNVLGI
jgi:hypothetical protein